MPGTGGTRSAQTLNRYPTLILRRTPYITPTEALTARGMNGYHGYDNEYHGYDNEPHKLTYVDIDTFLATL